MAKIKIFLKKSVHICFVSPFVAVSDLRVMIQQQGGEEEHKYRKVWFRGLPRWPVRQGSDEDFDKQLLEE